MRQVALITLALAFVGAGASALAASAGSGSAVRGPIVSRTAGARSVHFAVDVTLVKRRQPFLLHISGSSSRDVAAVHFRLADLKLPDGTELPGTTGALVLNRPFVYERAPGGVASYGRVHWLRLPARSQALSSVRALTPAPLLRVVAESRLRPNGPAGRYAGTVAYDDPVVRSALRGLADGIEFRELRVSVTVARDGLIHRIAIGGRTADGGKTFSLHARLYAFGAAVHVVPPKPGTFMDEQLSQLRS